MVRAAIACLAVMSTSWGAITFVFDYSASPEFTQGGQATTRKQSLETAARSLGELFHHDTTITIAVESSNDAASDTLASAASEASSVAGDFVGFAPDLIQKKILTGIDDNGATSDGSINVNFGQDWGFGQEVGDDFYDFESTMIHELLHALGFASGIDAQGYDFYGSELGSPSVWTPFDAFLSDASGRRLIDGNSSILNLSLWESVSVGGVENGLFFAGPNAMAANDGNPVSLYSPRTWEEGSSGSHLDDDQEALHGSLMLAAADTGDTPNSLSAIERGILKDLGYQLVEQVKGEPVLTVVGFNAGEGVQLQLEASPGTYLIEQSGDLQMWTRTATIELERNVKHFQVAFLTRERFYRVHPE